MSEFVSDAERHAKEAERYPGAFGAVNLTHIRAQVAEILKLVGRGGVFDEYTLHDMNHVDAMLQLVDRLIPSKTKDALTAADWLHIVLSCYFHDLGMLVTKSEFAERAQSAGFQQFLHESTSGDRGRDYEAALAPLTPEDRDRFLYQEFVRKVHPIRIAEWIRGEFGSNYGVADAAVAAVGELLGSLDKVFRNDLAMICQSHHESDLYDLDKYRVRRVYGESRHETANLQYSAIILRAADVMQIQRKRVPSVLFKLIDPSNPTSQYEWAKQAGVRAVVPREEDGVVEVHASFEGETAYFGLLAYLEQYGAREMNRCADWAELGRAGGADAFEFPWRKLDTTQVEPLGFEGKTYAFRLDQEKILRLLTGHTLYNDPTVAVREVVQNAIDAVRFRAHIAPAEAVGKVEVTWDTRTRKLVVRDTGTGMTQRVIESFLLNVGASYYQSDEVRQRYGSFSAISRFGIGVLSAFMIADEVQILTVHPDEEHARRLTLPSVVKSYLVKKLNKGDASLERLGAHGTEVTLSIRRSISLDRILDLLRYWVVVPKVEVTCAVDGGKARRVGFSDVKEALEFYFVPPPYYSTGGRSVEVRLRSEPGRVNLAYAVSYSPHFKTWDYVLSRGRTADRSAQRQQDQLGSPPGACVEGMRVLSGSAGFHDGHGPWALVDYVGATAPRTTVARLGLEQNEELDRVYLDTYRLLFAHVQEEFDRMREAGVGVLKAAEEAEIIRGTAVSRGMRSSVAIFNDALDELRTTVLDSDGAFKVVSRRDVAAADVVWTVDSHVLSHLEGLCGYLGADISAQQVVQLLGGALSSPLPSPRLVGRRTEALRKLEVARICIDREQKDGRVDLEWRPKEGRWMAIPDEVLRHMEPSYDARTYDYLLATASIETGNTPLDLLYWRNFAFVVKSEGLRQLIDSLPAARAADWMGEVLRTGGVPQRKRGTLRDELAGLSSIEFDILLGQLEIPFDRRYGIDWIRRSPE